MTLKTIKKISSELAINSSNELSKESAKNGGLPVSLFETWASLPDHVRSALVNSELSGVGSKTVTETSSESGSSNLSSLSEKQSEPCNIQERNEVCPETGATISLKPLERAPLNVFEFTKTYVEIKNEVKKCAGKTIETTTKIISTGKGWRNVFTHPISYDVNMVPDGTLLDPSNLQLLHSTGAPSEEYKRRFAVVDTNVDRIYGKAIRNYFDVKDIELTVCVINGGEDDKRPAAIDTILDELCAYKLRRREPFLAIGGGVVLDIAGTAACLYRRGVPFVRVPTTLLAIVDASVGVKSGVDYDCCVTKESYKNRVGSFYAPSSCLLDNSFIATQDARNISNGLGEVLKLALVRSTDLFELLESHGAALIESRFAATATVPDGASSRIIELSIQIMLEELGPNLWEQVLDRCVDYGHTFSKLLEMVPGADVMHGEAVNIDGFFCVVLSYIRGYIGIDLVNRVFKCMQSLSLPTNSPDLQLDLAWQSCKDAIEHRHGEQRIPLITEIGESICVSDITREELGRALETMQKFAH